MEFHLKSENLWSVIRESPEYDEQWKVKDGKVRTIIEESIENDQIVHIRDKTTAAEMWQTLKTIHDIECSVRSDSAEPTVTEAEEISFIENSIIEIQMKLTEIEANLKLIFDEVIEIRKSQIRMESIIFTNQFKIIN